MSGSGKKILQGYVSNQVKSLQGLTYSPYQDPLVYWKLLNSAGMDYNGQISMLFDQLEYKLEVKAKFTPHDLLVPGLSILKGSITVDANASTTAESMMVLQRFPDRDYDDLAKKVAWRTEQPLGLTAFQGAIHKLQVKLGSSLGIGTPDLVDSFGLKFSLSVSGSIEVGVEYLRMEAPAPTFYPVAPSIKGRILGGASAIQRAMDELVFGLDKDKIDDLDNWILVKFKQILEDKTSLDEIPGASKLVKKLETVKRASSRIFSDLSKRLRPDFKKINDWDRVWNRLEQQHPKFVDRWPHFLMFLIKDLELASFADGSAKRKQTLFDLLNVYAQLYFRLKNSPPQATRAEVSPDSIIEDSITILEEEAVVKKPQGLTQLRLLAFNGGSKLGVGGTQAAGVKMPILDIKPINSAASASAMAMINAGVEVNSKLVSYRFQSFVEGHLLNPSRPRVLHLTQDTYVSYQQAKLGVDILGKLGFAHQDYTEQTKVAEKQIHQSLTYCSVVRYWQPYAADKVFGNIDSKDKKSVKIQGRSGFSYGMSIITRRLIACAKDSSKHNDLLIAICSQLRIPKDKLTAFLEASDVKTLNPEQSGLPKVVFIESNFRFTVGQTTQVEKKAYENKEEGYYFEPVDGFKDEDLNQSYEIRKIVGERDGPKQPPQTLESIRIRMRLEDVDSNTQTVFKLGFPKVYIVNLKFKITRMQAAGREACFDLFVQWYRDDKAYEPDNIKEAQENSVPPVVLLHL